MTLTLAILLAAFAALAWLVQSGGLVVTLDGLVQSGLAPLRSRPMLLAFQWLTQFGTGGTGAAVSAAASALLWSAGRGALVGPLWLAFIGAEASTWSIKFLTARVRPPFLEGLSAGSPSFPSAHATVSIAVYGFLALATAAAAPERWRMEILAATALLILLISFSRLLLSLHYLSDVIGGLLIGAFWLLLAWRWAHQP